MAESSRQRRSGSAISRRPTSSKQKRTCARARQRWMQTTATRPLRAPVGTGGQCFNTALPSPRPQRGFCSHARKENRSPRARARDALRISRDSPCAGGERGRGGAGGVSVREGVGVAGAAPCCESNLTRVVRFCRAAICHRYIAGPIGPTRPMPYGLNISSCMSISSICWASRVCREISPSFA